MSSTLPSTELILTPLRPATPIEGGIVDLLIRLQAPDAPAERVSRQRLRLALVIDRSGSMDGEPLDQAVRCAQHLIERLQADDEVAVVFYDDEVDVAIPLQPVAGVARAAAALGLVRSGGSTALHAGWQAGLAQLGGGKDGAVSRVVLLSDGQANSGPATLDAYTADLHAAVARGLSTTTVGLGRGFHEDLMIGIARLGGGQSYYGQTAADLADPFGEEFALLQALCARQNVLHLSPGAGVQWEPLGDLQADQRAGTLALPDLAWGAEAWAVVRLHVAPATGSEVDRRHLLSVRASGVPTSADIVLASTPVRLDLSGLPAATVDALDAEPLVSQRRAEALFGTALAHIHTALSSGSPAAIAQALAEAETLSAGQPWLAAKLASLKTLARADTAMASKEARYSQRKMSARLAAKLASWEGESWSGDTSALSIEAPTSAADVPKYLRKKVSEGTGGSETP